MTDRLDEIRMKLENLYWGSAPNWDEAARAHILDYYRRVLPAWPRDLERVFPHEYDLTAPYLGRLTPPERQRVNECVVTILAASQHHGGPLDTMTKALLPLMLACALLVSRGALEPEADPSVPLLALFAAGFTLHPTHDAVELVHTRGMNAVRLPLRSDIEALADGGYEDPQAGA